MNPGEVNVEVHYPDPDNTGENIMEPFRGATVKDARKEINDFLGACEGDVIVKTSDGELPDDDNIFLKDITGNKETLRLNVRYAEADELLGGTEDRQFKLELGEDADAADATSEWTRTIMSGPEKDFKMIKIEGKQQMELPTTGLIPGMKKGSFVILHKIEEMDGDAVLRVKKFKLKKKGPVRIVKMESSPDNGCLLDTDKIFLNEEDITDQGFADVYYGKYDQAKKTLDDYHKEYHLKTQRKKAENGPMEAILGGASEGAVGGLVEQIPGLF